MKKGGHGASPELAVRNREDSHRGFLSSKVIFFFRHFLSCLAPELVFTMFLDFCEGVSGLL